MALSVDQALAKAKQLTKQGDVAKAEVLYKSVLTKFPKNQRATKGLLALKGHQNQRAAQPDDSQLQALITLYQQGRYHDLIDQAGTLSDTFPRCAMLYELQGAAHTGLSQFESALGMLKTALGIAPNSADTNNNMGNILRQIGDYDGAMESYRRAIKVHPKHALAHNSLGITLWETGAQEAAVESYSAAIGAKPDFADAHNNLGFALNDCGEKQAAIDSYRRAIKHAPNFAEAHNNLGNTLLEMGAVKDAITHFHTAVALAPDKAAIHNNLGNAMQETGDRPKAIASYARATELAPDYQIALSQKLHQLSHTCDWDAIEADRSVIAGLGTTNQHVDPFNMLSLEDAPERHQQRAKLYTDQNYPQPQLPLQPHPAIKPKRLRIGYFSADFQNHPGMYLMAGMLAAHDRAHFEIYAYSYGPNSEDDMRHRVIAAVDVFKHVRHMTDIELAMLARRDKIDIAVHRNGHTKNARSGIFAYRAAPVQINYLGYPGTLGADFMDYIVADKRIIPDGDEIYFTENIIHLPHTYQPTDNQRTVSRRRISRTEMGLPQTGFVFCCFNNNYKISAAEFDIWMRLLAQVEGSVLWLLKSNQWAENNLRQATIARGIAPDRLVFAEKLLQAEHLARQSLADLFLDTFNYNAHTTASDALWMGLPVITKMGRGFAARVAGSLLTAMNMPELITETEAAYERLALDLAQNPDRVAALRQKITANRTTAPLFDTDLYARHLETGYQRAYGRYFEGKACAQIIV